MQFRSKQQKGAWAEEIMVSCDVQPTGLVYKSILYYLLLDHFHASKLQISFCQSLFLTSFQQYPAAPFRKYKIWIKAWQGCRLIIYWMTQFDMITFIGLSWKMFCWIPASISTCVRFWILRRSWMISWLWIFLLSVFSLV